MELTNNQKFDLIIEYCKKSEGLSQEEIKILYRDLIKKVCDSDQVEYNNLRTKIVNDGYLVYSNIGYVLSFKGKEFIGYEKTHNIERKEKAWKKWQLRFDVVSKPVMVLLAAISLGFGVVQFYNNKAIENKYTEVKDSIQSIKARFQIHDKLHTKKN